VRSGCDSANAKDFGTPDRFLEGVKKAIKEAEEAKKK